MSLSAEWISAIGAIFTPLSVLLVLIEVRWDHERSRRTKAWDILTHWTRAQTHAMTSAAVIVGSLTRDCLRDFVDRKPFKVKRDYLHHVKKCLDDAETSDVDPIAKEYDEEVMISGAAAAEIRWHATEYLDAIEAVLIAWRLKIVTDEILIEEMKPLFAREDLLSDFRALEGGRSIWPSIYEFEDFLKRPKKSRWQRLGFGR